PGRRDPEPDEPARQREDRIGEDARARGEVEVVAGERVSAQLANPRQVVELVRREDAGRAGEHAPAAGEERERDRGERQDAHGKPAVEYERARTAARAPLRHAAELDCDRGRMSWSHGCGIDDRTRGPKASEAGF